MKRTKLPKLQLNRETLHNLDLAEAAGGIVVMPLSVNNNCSNLISICITCTTPIDGCPPVYTTPAYTCA
jgi:hypothetical protein